MSIIKEAKKIGVLMASALVLSYAGYASSTAGNKNSEIEKLIKQQYNNQNYDLMTVIKELYQDLQKRNSVQIEKLRKCHLKWIKMKKIWVKILWH